MRHYPRTQPNRYQMNTRVTKRVSGAALFAVYALSVLNLSTASIRAQGASGVPDFIKDTRNIGRSNNGYVTSDQFLELGVPTPNALRLEGENSLRTGNLERALMMLQRSVELAPLDMDGRLLYAQALQWKYREKQGNDPVLYNFLVKQWLFIYRRSDFRDQQGQALSELVAITGTKPKRFESEKDFLLRVMKPETEKVALKEGEGRAEESDDKQKEPEILTEKTIQKKLHKIKKEEDQDL